MASEKAPTNRKYKDSVFVDLFSQDKTAPANFISLYNALHDTNYTTETAQIQNIKLENIIYTSFYNDVSFVINDKIIILVEHQSTINENMPLRFLEYIGRLYEKILSVKDRYARTLKKIPSPEFYVLYNGEEDYPTEKTLKLSDAFIKSDELTTIPLELEVKVININAEKHAKILEKCEPLKEYSLLIDTLRKHLEADPENGFESAIKECLQNDILAEYLRRKTKEVMNMLVAEYSYETDVEVQREEAWNAGISQGKSEGITQGILQGISQGVSQGAYAAKIETARSMVAKNFQISVISEITGLSVSEIEKL